MTTAARRALALYVLRNSGFRIWLADRLVAIAGRLNPAKPWKRLQRVDESEDAW